jgi:hypothetical protein
MVSGIFLAMHYTPHVDLAFSSVEYIMRDVPNGWLLRYVHANGASMFFIVVYCHIFRGLVLWILYEASRIFMVFRSNSIRFNDGYCFYRLCSYLGVR